MAEARIPNPKGPLVDPETGVITTAWWRFFHDQFERVGGVGDISLQPAGDDLTAIEALSGTGDLHRTATNTWALRTLSKSGDGIIITFGDGVSGNPTVAVGADLEALEDMSGTGLAVHTGVATWTERTLTGSGDGIVITNGNGVSGNPTVAVDADLEALVDLGGTGGLTVHTAANAWAERTITAATVTPGAVGLSVSDGDGVSGNPTVAITTSATNSITSGTTQTQAGATALTTRFNRVTTHGNTDDGVKLPAAVAGIQCVILNDTATADLQVWPATADAIEAASADAVGVTKIGAGVATTYEAVDAVTWYITNQHTTP